MTSFGKIMQVAALTTAAMSPACDDEMPSRDPDILDAQVADAARECFERNGLTLCPCDENLQCEVEGEVCASVAFCPEGMEACDLADLVAEDVKVCIPDPTPSSGIDYDYPDTGPNPYTDTPIFPRPDAG